MIELLVGTIASGKSTYARKRAEQGFVIINDDSIVTALHGGVYTMYEKRLKPLYKTVENTIFAMAVTLGKSIVIDRGTNMTQRSRRRWIGLADSMDRQIDAIIFPMETPEVHALRRYKSDNRGLTYHMWLEAAEKHIREYKEPTQSEGFSDAKKV